MDLKSKLMTFESFGDLACLVCTECVALVRVVFMFLTLVVWFVVTWFLAILIGLTFLADSLMLTLLVMN